jgi:dihydrofolate synthase/folylpolyglutamate synthase
METGVGGRYDPSNVLPSKLAVITNVDYDHIKPLGPTLKDIALHKAGIIKAGRPAITASTNPEVLEILRAEATTQSAHLYEIGRDFAFSDAAVSAGGVNLTIEAPHRTYRNLNVGLRGSFQAINAALAVSAADLLAHEYGLSLSEDAVRRGLQTVQLHGRMEIVQQSPLVILDGAHNPHKMRSLAESLEAIYPGRPVTAVVGMLMTKDAESMLAALVPVAQRIVVTRPNVLGKPSVSPEELARAIQTLDPTSQVEIAPEIESAIQTALRLTSPDGLVVITGSLYLIGAARNHWFPPETLLEI